MGKGTRTELKEMIRRGRITVNGVIVKKPETKIKKGEDTICLDNAPVEYVELEYYLLNNYSDIQVLLPTYYQTSNHHHQIVEVH